MIELYSEEQRVFDIITSANVKGETEEETNEICCDAGAESGVCDWCVDSCKKSTESVSDCFSMVWTQLV